MGRLLPNKQIEIHSRYTHFEPMPDVQAGQRPKMGDVIGPTGNTGIMVRYTQPIGE
ncbi:MAG: hypothetical protein ABW092_08490 [Candidatus Thiodiazotropha sp.]